MRLLICCLLLFFGSKSLFAQDQIAQKIEWLGKAKPTTNLFVHFDKNVYSNNETVYFTGYLIKAGTNAASTHKIMAVALVRNADSTVIIEDKFVMQDGLSFGSVTIPDSLLTGSYRLFAYTDKLTNGVPDVIYEQPITIKTNIDPEFKASMKLLEDKKKIEKSHNVLVSVTTKTGGFLSKPTSINYKYGNLNIQTKTDASGQLLINLPPQANIVDPNLYVNLKNVKESSFINMAIPQSKSRAEVKFYPEGGNLIHNVYSTIGWEVKDQQKKPIALKAFLYKNENVIDTIESSTYGIGKFNLFIEKDATYKLKLVHDGLVDSTYQLPKAIPDGLALTILEAVAQDTLKVSLRTNSTRNLFIRIHNFRETYLSFPLDMVYNQRTFKIPLTALPKGLATITITDSLERPLAERMFFARYQNTERLNMELEKPIYEQRDSVNIKLKLNDIEEKGIVSIAVVQNNRLDLKNIDDAESYTYLKNELANLPLNINGLPYKDKNYLEQVLLVKGWRRYNWQDLHFANTTNFISKTDSLQLLGSFTKSNKELPKSISFGAFGKNNISILNTTEKGYFNFNRDELILEQNQRNFLFINEKNKLGYTLHINDQFSKMSETLTKSLKNETQILPSNIANNAELVIKGNEKAIRLQEVVIKSIKDNSLTFRPGTPGVNECGDYVCKFNILNCPNHLGDFENTQPIPGRGYRNFSDSNIRTYQECKTIPPDEQLFKFNGIHFQKEFYINDYKDPQEPAFFSTLFWSYATMLNAEKETTLSFHTSDITGKFKVVVQGITNKDVVYAEKFFEVTPKLNP